MLLIKKIRSYDEKVMFDVHDIEDDYVYVVSLFSF